MNKLYNERGETLIEVLASIVIGTLSLALMFGCIMAATDMDKTAKVKDGEHYLALTAADAQEAAPAPYPEPTPGIVIIKSVNPEDIVNPEETPEPDGVDLPIMIYGGEGVRSYFRSTGGD